MYYIREGEGREREGRVQGEEREGEECSLVADSSYLL